MEMIAEAFACEYEDFLKTNLDQDDRRPWNEALATGGTIAVQATQGGWLRCTLTNAETAAAAAAGPVQWEPDEMGGILWAKARVKTSNAGRSSIFFGFSDVNNVAVVIEDEDGTLNTAVSDAAGLLLEGEQLNRWQGVSVRGNVDGAQVDFNDIEAANDTWYFLRVEVNREGDVRWSVNGWYSEWQRGALDPSLEYCWVLSADGRAAAYNVDMDYYEVQGSRS